MLNGMRVLVSPHATKNVSVWAVERNPIPKRRRNWRVVRKTTTEPVSYMMDGTLIVHPTIFEKLKQLPENHHGNHEVI